MRVLIFGAKGSLGNQLIKVFNTPENEVIAWDRSEIDITDKELVNKKIDDIKPEIIINATAYNEVDKCQESEEDFVKAKKINGEAIGYLADASIRNKSLLVHYSTDYVFDGNTPLPPLSRGEFKGYREIDLPKPINKYGESKLLGEKELISRSSKGLKFYLIRTSKLFGPKGESKTSKPSFFDIMLGLAEHKDSLDIVDEEMSCFTYIPDLAEATKELVESKSGYGIYHIVNEGACTWYEATQELFRQANIDTRLPLQGTSGQAKINPVKSNKFPRPAKRPKYSVLLNTKLPKLRNYKEALKEYLNN